MVERLLVASSSAPFAAQPPVQLTFATVPSTVDRVVTRDQLERHLWSAADILRGSIDSSDYKNFIFGLLFLKRLSDVFEEEAEKLSAPRQ